MHLPKNHRLTIPPSFLKPLTRRDPANPNAPGLQGNKNGPPGPEGNQNGPPKAATGTEESVFATSQSPPPETTFADSPEPPASSFVRSNPLSISSSSTSSPNITPSSIIVTFSTPAPPATYTTSLPSIQSVASLISGSTLSWSDPTLPGTPTPLSTFAVSVAGILASATPSMESFITPDVSAGSVWGFTSTQYSMSPSSAVSDGSFPVETSPWTSFSYTGSMTAIETGWGYHSPNGTALSKSSVVSPGQKAGIAVGIIAGFCFILTLIVLLFKWRSSERPKALLGSMPDSLLASEAGSSDDPAWDHRATFAGPTVIEKTRQSLRKSLKLLRVNPLGLNPVSSRSTGTRTPSRKSFASSFFRRRSAASTILTAFRPSSLQEQPGSAIDPQSHRPPLPPHAARISPQPSAMSNQKSLSEAAQLSALSRVPPVVARLPAAGGMEQQHHV